MSRRIGFRHCDPRFGFLWRTSRQPPGRWHSDGEGPANYFADTPTGAWAEFLRHEGIDDIADLAGVRRSLWAVELPEAGYAVPALSDRVLMGGLSSYAACQAESRRLRAAGADRLEAPSAALLPGVASGWESATAGLQRSARIDGGVVWVLFGDMECRGWLAVDGGAAPADVLEVLNPLRD